MRFRVSGFGFRVSGQEFRVWGDLRLQLVHARALAYWRRLFRRAGGVARAAPGARHSAMPSAPWCRIRGAREEEGQEGQELVW